MTTHAPVNNIIPRISRPGEERIIKNNPTMMLRRVKVSIVMVAVVTNHSSELISQLVASIREGSVKGAQNVNGSSDDLESGADLIRGWILGWPHQTKSDNVGEGNQLPVHVIQNFLAWIFIIVLWAAFEFLR